MIDVLAVVTDLFFQSRISAAARKSGSSLRFLTRESELAGATPFALALVDLDARLDTLEAIRRLKSMCSSPVIAFGPHVDVSGRRVARAAGADRVLAKSKFVTELPRLMAQASSSRPESMHD